MSETAQILACSIMEKPHAGSDECPRILLLCFRAMNSDNSDPRVLGLAMVPGKHIVTIHVDQDSNEVA